MRERQARARLDRLEVVVLPADGATLGTSLSRRPILVAHTGRAHLGVTVDRGLLRRVARAQAAVRGTRGRGRADPRPPVAPSLRPDEIYFRHATSCAVQVSGGEVHLTLSATGDPGKPDVHVELRMSDQLLGRLEQEHRDLLRRRRSRLVGALLGLTGMRW